MTSAIDHKSVLEASARLESCGWRRTVVPVRPDGLVDLDALRDAVTDETALVSVMAANNEIGVIQPLAEIGAIAHARGALLHTDAAQAAGKIPIDVRAMHIDLLSLTAHKMYGPKGCGAIYIRKRTDVAPLIIGGGQERGLRAGTLNVPGHRRPRRACAICRPEMAPESRAARSRCATGCSRDCAPVWMA